MGDKIKTALELAMEKLGEMDELTEEEKQDLENKKKLEPLLAKFYKKKMSSEKLWKNLKGSNEKLLKSAQMNIIESITLSIEGEEVDRRKDGILALETLKENKNIPSIEQMLNFIKEIKTRSEDEKQALYDHLKAQVEQNPEARMREVQRGSRKVMMEMSTEQAIQTNPQYRQALAQVEAKYNQQMDQVMDRLKKEIG